MKAIKKFIAGSILVILFILLLPFNLAGAVFYAIKDAFTSGEDTLHKAINGVIDWAE